MEADEIPADAERASNEDTADAAPRKPRRRRRGRAGPAAARRPAEGPTSEPEAAAFLDPPPVADRGEGPGDAEGAPARGSRSRRRRGRRRRGAGEAEPTPREGREGEPPTSEAAAGPDAEGPSASAEGAGEPRSSRTRSRSRRRRGRGERPAEGPGDVVAEPDVEVPPLPGEGDARSDEPAQKPRRREGRRKGRKEASRERGKEARKDTGRERGKEGRRDASRERGREGRRGRGDGGRRSERGRGEGRGRDPRAIDIVPSAPDPSEAAKEKILLVNAADREEARIALLVDGRLEEIYVEMASSERSSAGNIYRGRVQNVEPGIGAAFVDLGRGLTGFLHVTDLPQPESEEELAKAVADRLHPGDEVIVQITRDSIGRKGPALTGRISFPGRYLVLMPFTARSGISRRIPQGTERERVRRLVRELEVPDGMGVIVRTASETTDLAALQADLDHLLTEWEFIKRKAAEPGQPGVLRGESDLAERSVRDIMPGDVRRIIVDRDEMAGQIHRLLRVWYPSAAAAADEAAHAAVRTATAALDTPLGELRARPAAPAVARAPAAQPAAPGTPPEATSGGGDAPGGDEPVEPVEPVEPAAAPHEAAADVEGGEPGVGAEPAAQVPHEEAAPAPVESEEERLRRLERLARAMPEVELHTDPLPLFHRFGVESQIEDAFRRTSRLPSGGSIVIDPTEALVSVDVNSGRLTGEADPESTALVTNLEAVVEAARQLRLRDLGGLVVIDFIDMKDRKSRRKVEVALREALSHDRARIRMGHMGPFGLVVLSRQRIRQALSRVTHDACTACAGTGRKRLVSGLGLRVLREMEARVARSRGRGGLEVRAPQEVIAWIKKHRPMVVRRLAKACTGPVALEVDARLASDGWAMKGLPPVSGGPAPEGEADEQA